MKVTIIGSGNVGATCASILAQKDIVDEIILLDSKEKLSEGKSLDISQMTPITRSNTKVWGFHCDFSKSRNSEIIIITCGITRKANMSRDDLVQCNMNIIASVTKKSQHLSPNAKFIVVSNPLDIMTYICYINAKISRFRIIGMAGILDCARYKYFLSKKLNVSSYDIQSLFLGSHGDTMVPLYRYTSISGIPITEFISEIENDILINKTKKGGEEIINYIGNSAWMAPSISIVEIIEAIIKDSKRIFPCSILLKGEYNIHNICLGVPVVIGKSGIDRIIELKLNEKEKYLLKQSEKQIQKIIYRLRT
ncbi:malate dehydrogenase [Blattabacterium cuenoti]|uniref:malate dehydrogenase n=1 Tax=Blattabacterium cuenoti TaxID=1653831 RepID=UPI00163BC790|nr:malate dehydrogenase [Blattabacterium cuenoti]